MADPLTIEPTAETGRRVGSISPTPVAPGVVRNYIVGADFDLYVGHQVGDEEGLIVQVDETE